MSKLFPSARTIAKREKEAALERWYTARELRSDMMAWSLRVVYYTREGLTLSDALRRAGPKPVTPYAEVVL